MPCVPGPILSAMNDQDHITRDQTASTPCVAGRLLPCQDGHPQPIASHPVLSPIASHPVTHTGDCRQDATHTPAFEGCQPVQHTLATAPPRAPAETQPVQHTRATAPPRAPAETHNGDRSNAMPHAHSGPPANSGREPHDLAGGLRCIHCGATTARSHVARFLKGRCYGSAEARAGALSDVRRSAVAKRYHSDLLSMR